MQSNGSINNRSEGVKTPQKGLSKNARILIVEDNLTNQILIRDQFRVLGYTVRIVGGAIEALKLLSEERFDIAFMDCEMPGMNGYEATAEMRRREGNGKSMTIIGPFTAHVTKEERQRCVDCGMTDYISKPVKLGELTRILDLYTDNVAIAETAMQPSSN